MSSAIEHRTFKYRPLVKSDSFRLISLQPARSHAAEIQCNLVHSTLSQCDHEIIEHYTALSYVWGNPSQTGLITVDGHRLTITATLEAALRDLRDKTRPIRVWADALCIDQSNIDERNQQVRQMGRIYTVANHTIIHLGSLTAKVEVVLQAVLSKSNGIAHNLEPEAVARLIGFAENNLLNLPWFSRVWIFQELVLSRDPWVQCGTLRARWTDVCNLLLPYMGSARTPEGQQDKITGLKLLKEMHETREGRLRTRLFNLLLSRRGLGATDPRDMIFAHLGIASDRTTVGSSVQVDYRRSCSSVYTNVARYFIETIGPEQMFFHTDDISPEARLTGLASWAPDWSRPQSYSVPMYRNNRLNSKYLDAKSHYIFTQEEPSVMGYMGYDVDIISDVSITIPESSRRDSAHRDQYQQAVRDLRALYQSVGGSYASGDKDGQYTWMPLKGKEEEHTRLCSIICDEWIRILGEELPLLLPPPSADELKSHKSFLAVFSSWLKGGTHQGIIFIGGDSNGIESLMDLHLNPQSIQSLFNGRRLATTKKGTVGVVPSQARPGDCMVYLAGSQISLVLRKDTFTNIDVEDLNRRIREAFEAKDNNRPALSGPYVNIVDSFSTLFQTEDVAIEQAILIGECYVEGLVGWPVSQTQDLKIFAIR